MSTEPKKNQPTETETLFGGLDLTILLRANQGEANKEEVFVRQLGIEDYPELLRAQDDECLLAELFCNRPAGWAKSLKPVSLELVVTEGERLNSDFFLRWVQRRLARQEKLIPGFTEGIRAKALAPSLPSPQK